MNHYVYQIISMTPNEDGVCRIYSGLRSCECLPEEDTEYMGSGHAIKGAIAKYGRDKFMKLIIAKFSTREEAHECETNFLDKQFNFHGRDWKKFNKFHYNLRLNENDNGGNFHSPETREKMSEAKKGKFVGENNPNFGKQHSEEVRKKMGEARKGKTVGENNPMFGKQRSEEERKKIGEARKGKQHSDETKQRMSEARAGEKHPNFGKTGKRSSNFKGLSIGINKNNQTVVFCGNVDMKSRGFANSNVSAVITGNQASYKGFKFIRTSDPDQLRELLNTAEFVDDVSKQRIQEFLSQ